MRWLWVFAPVAAFALGSATPPAQVEAPTLTYEDVTCLPSCGPAPPGPASSAVPRTGSAGPAAGSDVRLLVSLPQQRLWVFRGAELVATSPVSTGKRGHETPVGTFPILQKKVHHRSNRYSNAPMPYMQRLTSYGIALHGGALPGYPASHGCIRLPHAFAKRLYGLTGPGTRVTVTRARPRSAAAAARLA